MTSLQISSMVVSPPNPREITLHDAILDIITRNMKEDILIEDDSTLQFEDPYTSHVLQDSLYEEDEPISSCEQKHILPSELCTSEEREIIDFEYKTRAVEFWTSGERKRHSLKSVQHRFKKVKSLSQLYTWEAAVKGGGTLLDKANFIAEYVFDKFKISNDKRMIVHDTDIRRWALEAKDEINYPSFKGGKWWVWNFKKNNGIVSRKITKFTTQSTYVNVEEIETTSTVFVNDIKQLITNFGEDNVYNADESGFTLEIHSGRTLTEKGVKKVEAVVQSLPFLTHSCTILPTISATGKLLAPLLIVLKERTGTLGPHVQETLFRPSNVYISATTSGKLTSNEFKNWFTDIFLPHTGQRSVLLLDSWGGHCPVKLEPEIPHEKEVVLRTIPKKTTGLIQPLDVYGFRIWKNFIRTFSDRIMLLNLPLNLHLRNNIIKLQSLTHNQLSSPRFHNLFKYAWYKSGYLPHRPEPFENPVSFCYPDTDFTPRCAVCGKPALLRCAWCKKDLCFEHFFDQYHFCSEYEP